MKGIVAVGTVCLLALGLMSARATSQGRGASGAASVKTDRPAPRLANGRPSMAGV